MVGMAEQRRDSDMWTSAAAYERYMGRWSRVVAREFVAWLDRAAGLRWLDVGCGTGVLSTVVAERCEPRAVLGCDRSDQFVSAAAQFTASSPASGSPRFLVADASALPVRDGVFDVAISGLTLNFLPEPAIGVSELTRSVRPGGLVAAYVWDYGDGMGLLRRFWDAAAETDPAAAVLDEGRRFPDCHPQALHTLWTGAGLTAVSTAPIEVPTVFADFADLWTPFLSGQGPAPAYVASLTPAERDRVRETLRTTVPTEPDGSVPLTARAWAVRGIRP